MIQYAKAYTASKNRWEQLDANEVFNGQPPGALHFHNDTMQIRNQYLEHSGHSTHESRVMVALRNPDLIQFLPQTLWGSFIHYNLHV